MTSHSTKYNLQLMCPRLGLSGAGTNMVSWSDSEPLLSQGFICEECLRWKRLRNYLVQRQKNPQQSEDMHYLFINLNLTALRLSMHILVAFVLSPSCILKPLNFPKCFLTTECIWVCNSCTSLSFTDGETESIFIAEQEPRQDQDLGSLTSQLAHSHQHCQLSV